jgi:SAM-dependent methyltransferase
VTEIRSWHHGLVARWWAEFNRDGDDIAYFRDVVRRSGEPVLDVGCGTGRVLLPLLRDGVDVDGADASADMLDWCRRTAGDSGFEVDLARQAIHELDRPRRYRTIIVCGAFGLGGTRDQDLEGLRRLREHLLPGGALVLDHHLPNLEDPRSWVWWAERPELPQSWPSRGMRRRAADGTELELRARITELDPLEQTTTLAIRVAHLVEGQEVNVETGLIDINLYLKSEIELMLDCVGFDNVVVTGFPSDEQPRPWEHARIVFHARAAAG